MHVLFLSTQVELFQQKMSVTIVLLFAESHMNT